MKKSLFLTSAIMTAVLAVGLSTSTYAWYQTTIGNNATTTTTVTTAGNKVGTGFVLTAPIISSIANGETEFGTTGINNDAANTNLAKTHTLSKSMVGADYGYADSESEAAKATNHWFTAVILKNADNSTTEQKDTTTDGILALKFSCTVPSYGTGGEEIGKNYDVEVKFTNVSLNGMPFVYSIGLPTSTAGSAAASGTSLTASTIKTLDITNAEQTFDVYVWIEGNQVGETANSKIDVDNKNANFTLELSPKYVNNNGATQA